VGLDKYGYKAMCDTGRNMEARVSSIIRDGDWFWPVARLDNIVEIQSRLHEVQISEADQFIWNSKNEIYSCAETLELFREKKKTVISWYKIVWFPMAIPRSSFILWLVFKDAIVTKLKMCGWGYGSDTLRRFCYGKQESVEHLFIHCSFSRRV